MRICLLQRPTTAVSSIEIQSSDDLRSKTRVASMLARALREPFKSFGEQTRPVKAPEGFPIEASIT